MTDEKESHSIKFPCGVHVPCSVVGNINTVTMACQELAGHDGPHVVHFSVGQQWRVRVEAEEIS